MEKSGYLTKRGGVRHNWLRRWCVLDAQRLTCFESEDASSPVGAIEMPAVMQVRASSAPGATAEEVEVVAKERVYRLRADSAEQRDAWLAALLGALPGTACTKEAEVTAVAMLSAKAAAAPPPGPVKLEELWDNSGQLEVTGRLVTDQRFFVGSFPIHSALLRPHSSGGVAPAERRGGPLREQLFGLLS